MERDLFYGHTFYSPAPWNEIPEGDAEVEDEVEGDDEEENI